MNQACRHELIEIAKGNVQAGIGQPAHAGLLLDRFLEIARGSTGDNIARLKLLQNAITAADNAQKVYQLAYARWEKLLPLGSRKALLPTTGRMITGIGRASVLETGIRLHHVYGTPMIDGSSLKGLAAHYCDEVWGNRNAPPDQSATNEELGFRRLRPNDDSANGIGRYHQILFGTTAAPGFFEFHDAWIDPKCLHRDAKTVNGAPAGLVLDVITPHHGDYYAGKENNAKEMTAPTDFDNPIPISFLSASGSFLVAITCRDAGNEKWLGLAWQLVQEALQNWGAGAKTSRSYGRLRSENSPNQ